jgi:hypothetical protein
MHGSARGKMYFVSILQQALGTWNEPRERPTIFNVGSAR